jgi:hypothetical protein
MIKAKILVERQKLCCKRVTVGKIVENRPLSRKRLTARPDAPEPAIQHLASDGAAAEADE